MKPVGRTSVSFHRLLQGRKIAFHPQWCRNRADALCYASNRRYTIYGAGNNINGALGLGVNGSKIPIEQAVKIPFFQDKQVVDVDCGWGHSAVIVSASGAEGPCEEVYVMGRTHDMLNTIRFGRLFEQNSWIASQWIKLGGYGSVDSPTPDKCFVSPNRAMGAGRLTTCVAGAGVTALVSNQQLFMFGNNQYGQCGVGHTSSFLWKLERSALPPTCAVSKISIGYQHALCLTSAGDLFVFGKSERGQLGNGVLQDSKELAQSNPEQLDCQALFQGEKLADCVAGFNTSLYLTESGKLFVSGKFQGLQPNQGGTSYVDQFVPREVSYFQENNIKIHRIYASSYYFAVLGSQSGDQNSLHLYLWGIVPDAIDLTTVKQQIRLHDPMHEDLASSHTFPDASTSSFSLLQTESNISRTIHKPFKLDIPIDCSTKIFPGYTGLYLVRNGGRNLSYLDWNLVEKPIDMSSITETERIKSISVGWNHMFLLAE